MGTVYLAEDTKLPGKQWAIKAWRPHPGQRTATADEARILARLSHPLLPAVADFFSPEEEGTCYLVMEWVKGRTLQELIRDLRPFPWDKAVDIAVQLCEVLAYLHGQKPNPVIYRDLKPSNIMVEEQWRIRLIDFGTARIFNPQTDEDTVHLGTMGFAAPEQYLGKQTDARTDLYALGALLYYLLSGGQHYDLHDRKGSPPRERLPEGLTGIVLKLLKPEPVERYQTADEVRQELLMLQTIGTLREVTFGGREQEQSNCDSAVRSLPRKLIVVGSLYSGAGASFIAAAVARMLNRCRVPHAYIEMPGTGPDLYQLLDGDRRAPEDYRFKTEAAEVWENRTSAKAWNSGYTEWVPLPPDRPLKGWSAESAYRLMNGFTQPILLVDIGNQWDLQENAAICTQADMIVLVCGPSLVKLSSPAASAAWTVLEQLESQGCPVYLVANKDHSFRGRREWLQALPVKTICSIREFPSGPLLECEWKGELWADRKEEASALSEDLQPLLVKIIPGVREKMTCNPRRLCYNLVNSIFYMRKHR